MYGDLIDNISQKNLEDIYNDYYKNSPYTVVSEKSPNSADVRGSNRCAVKPAIDERTGKFYAISTIDNLLKGQSGNAIQNANIMMGFDETMGINIPAFYP